VAITHEQIVQLTKTCLFSGIAPDEAACVLAGAGLRVKTYRKNAVIIAEGVRVSDICVILSGLAYATKLDACGKRIIIAAHGVGAVIGDVLSASKSRGAPVTVTAQEAVTAVLIPFKKAVFLCGRACPAHERLLLNLFDTISGKFFEMQNRFNCIIRPTLREKILFYLEGARGQSRGLFTIPFDRAGLADYLNTDRSALSRELSLMKKDGLIDYYKNSFRLL